MRVPPLNKNERLLFPRPADSRRARMIERNGELVVQSGWNGEKYKKEEIIIAETTDLRNLLAIRVWCKALGDEYCQQYMADKGIEQIGVEENA